jgi:repressor LexA
MADYQGQYGRPPSIREIGEKVKISSTSVVNYYLDQLEKKGYLERDDRVSRGLRLTEKVSEIIKIAGDLLRVPILGPIAAGSSSPCSKPGVSYMTDNEANAVDIARSLLPSKEKGNESLCAGSEGRLNDRCHDQRWRHRRDEACRRSKER